MWKFLGGEFLQPNVKLVGDGNLERLHIRIADYGDVAACRGPLDADGFAVGKSQCVRARDGPEIKPVRMAHLRVGCEYSPHSWIPSVRNVALHEGRPQPEVRFTDDSNQRQARTRNSAFQPTSAAHDGFSFPPESWRRFAFRRADGELGHQIWSPSG